MFNEDRQAGAVITCYSYQKLHVGSLLFTNGESYLSPLYKTHPNATDYAVLKVVSTFEKSFGSGNFRFVGVAIGEQSDADHGFVAVQVSGIAEVNLHDDDVNDSNDPVICMDLMCADTNPDGTLRTDTLHPLCSPTAHVKKFLDQTDSLAGRKMVGCLLAHGRSPSTICKVLLLPGLSTLPLPPRPAIAPVPTPPSSSLVDVSKTAAIHTSLLTLSQIQNVCHSTQTNQLNIMQKAGELDDLLSQEIKNNAEFKTRVHALLS